MAVCVCRPSAAVCVKIGVPPATIMGISLSTCHIGRNAENHPVWFCGFNQPFHSFLIGAGNSIRS
jgi:hypothetical protein